MSMTTYEPTNMQVAGYVDVAIGAGFANVNTPKLSELTMLVTCAIQGVTSTTNLQATSQQGLCNKDAYDVLRSRTRTLEQLIFKGDGAASETAFLALVAEEALAGMFVRPYKRSVKEGGTALAVGDKGDAYNFKVGSLDRGPVAVGGEWTYVVTSTEVKRSSLNVALIA